MRFERYADCSNFMNDTLDVLFEHEAQNIHIIGTLKLDSNMSREFAELFEEKGWNDEDSAEIRAKLDELTFNHPRKLLATIKDSHGGVLITAYCPFPYSRLMLFGTRNNASTNAIELLAEELKSIGFKLPKVQAEQSLAAGFAEAYGGKFTKHVSMCGMVIDKAPVAPSVSGFCRQLEERDLHFSPFWKAECLKECKQDPIPLKTLHHAHSIGVGDGSRYLWDDSGPVSQTNIADDTDNCTAISDVYTPPFYRKKGYATALVSAVSKIILERGRRYCVLFADSSNPTSCDIYRKVGYYDICIVDEVKLCEEG